MAWSGNNGALAKIESESDERLDEVSEVEIQGGCVVGVVVMWMQRTDCGLTVRCIYLSSDLALAHGHANEKYLYLAIVMYSYIHIISW